MHKTLCWWGSGIKADSDAWSYIETPHGPASYCAKLGLAVFDLPAKAAALWSKQKLKVMLSLVSKVFPPCTSH